MPFLSRLSPALCLVATLGLGVTLPVTAARSEDDGAYLAAQAAAMDNNYAEATKYYQRLLADDPTDGRVQEGLLISLLSLGDVDAARDLAAQMVKAEKPSQVAVLVMLADAAKSGNFAAGDALLAKGGDAGQLVSGLYKAWALAGSGKMSEAMEAFDKLGKIDGLDGFAGYHRALASALVGDYESAEAIFSGKYADYFNSTRRGILAHVQVLSQLERDQDAIALIDKAYGAALPPEIAAIRKQLEAGETLPFTRIGSARDGVAEVFQSVALALNADSLPGFALIHARLALWLQPDDVDAALLAADILETQDQFDLAIAAYAEIGPDNPAFYAAELGRAQAMVSAGRSDAAIEVLEQLSRTHPDLPNAWSSLGDTLRREERYAEAAKAYDKAIALNGEPRPEDWGLWYSRAIAQERSGAWKEAEKGFREALKLSPDQPAVLNYLGYSYVEKRENLKEALEMIEKAVAGRPDDGYITDSLGWAYYRLGRYDEAVAQMEKAVELTPADPLLNDHLGDVYWAVGRSREAEFQWRRALNLGPADDLDLNRVRRKLEVGLDVVLKEEGAKPLHPEHAQN
ncbi:tetratricopeptide repeat protein [Rhodobacter capsulatus]|uniref:tetratricopeptide repeat protein n=1 Tax=Rhodobacter capsulatus TaxID=1061 RepID=UPI004025CF1E